MPITLSFSPPIAFARFDGAQTEAELEAYILDFDKIIARRQPYAVITWMQSYSQSPALIARMGRWLKESDAAMRELCVATSIIASSPTFRFTLSTLFLIKPMACPYLVCETFPRAMEFLREHSARRGLALPAGARCPWPDVPVK